MNYERFADRYDFIAPRGFYPDLDPEEDLNSEYPFNFLVDKYARSILNAANNKIDGNTSEQVAFDRSLLAIDWFTRCKEDGLNEALIVKKDNPVAARINSEIIDAAIPGKKKLSWAWADRYVTSRLKVVNDDDFKVLRCSYELGHAMFETQKRTGVRMFDLLAIHGATVLNLVARVQNEPSSFIVATNSDRSKCDYLPEKIAPSKFPEVERTKIIDQIKSVIDAPPLVDFIPEL